VAKRCTALTGHVLELAAKRRHLTADASIPQGILTFYNGLLQLTKGMP
jgi:hypothetical protein